MKGRISTKGGGGGLEEAKFPSTSFLSFFNILYFGTFCSNSQRRHSRDHRNLAVVPLDPQKTNA